MKKSLSSLLIACLLLLTPAATHAQAQSEPQFKLVQFDLGLLKKGPQWTEAGLASTTQLHQQHVAYIMSLLESGRAMIAGPLTDHLDIRGVYIFRTASAEEAKSWAVADPAVAAGQLVVELRPWWAQDVLKKYAMTTSMETAYLGILSRGEKWTAEKTPATEELQKAHLANIQRLAALKKLVVAGPFGDDTNLRGIFVFRVDSLAEAQTLAATDPAVKASRMVIDLHPWQVPAGILP